MNKILLVMLGAAAIWAMSMFGGDREMSLDYVPRGGYSDYRGDEMEEMFRDWDRRYHGDNTLEYRSRDSSGTNRSGGNTLDYRGRSATTGRYVHRNR